MFILGSLSQYFENIVNLANNSNAPCETLPVPRSVTKAYTIWDGWKYKQRGSVAFSYSTQGRHGSKESSYCTGDGSPGDSDGAKLVYKACMVTLLGLFEGKTPRVPAFRPR